MRIWLERISFIALGFLLACLVQWGITSHRWHVIHDRSNYRHGQPDFDAITKLGPNAVPDICTAIGETWQASDTVPKSSLISWSISLGSIRDRRAVPTLIALTDHQDSYMRLRAVLGLLILQDPRSLPALKRMEKDPDKRAAGWARDAVKKIETHTK